MMSHDARKQRLYKVTWREPDDETNPCCWLTRRATVACYSVKQAIEVIESHSPKAMITTVADHGEIDYHVPRQWGEWVKENKTMEIDMNLEQALQDLATILKGAMAADNKWLYLAANLTKIVDAAQVIVEFAIGLLASDDRVKSTPGTDVAGAELLSLLCDTMSETQPKPQMGPATWIAIAEMVWKLLKLIHEKRN